MPVPNNPSNYGKAPEQQPWDFNQTEYSLEQLIEACAWIADKPKDELTKADCKLPHHRPDGTLVWRGVAAAGAAIQGSRGGVDIPAGDLAAVKAHLAAHYHEYERKAPWEAVEMAGFEDEIEVFRAGEYPQAAITEADLDDVVKDYNSAVHEAPVVVGHPEHNMPAFGWVASLKREGGVLLATLKDVVPEFADAVKRGLFKKRSASFLWPHNSPTGRWYLNHIGFLGAAKPQIKGLKDITFADARQRVDFEFTVGADCDPHNKEDVMTEEQIKKITEDATAKATECVRAEFAGKIAGLEKENTALKERATQAEGRAAKIEASAARKDTAAFCDDLVRKGTLTPAMRDTGLVSFMLGLDAEAATVEFAQQDKTEKLSARGWFQRWLEGMPKAVNFSRVAGDGDAGGMGTAVGEDGQPVDPERAVLHKKVVNYMAQHKDVSYEQALRTVTKK